jgi:hypothetical protein
MNCLINLTVRLSRKDDISQESEKAKGKRQKAKVKSQKAKGKSQKANVRSVPKVREVRGEKTKQKRPSLRAKRRNLVDEGSSLRA